MQNLLSNKRRTQIQKLFWITLSWTIVSMYQFFNGYITLTGANCNLAGVDPYLHFKGSLLVGVLAGLTGGSAIIFLWENWLRTKPYGQTLINMFLSFSVVYLMVSIPTGLFFRIHENGYSLTDLKLWQTVLQDHLRPNQLFSYSFWLFVVLTTLVILLVNEKYGPGTFRAFLLGKYFHPKREERIFMFLDLRASTAITEKLGDERYFNFINDVFRIATPAILYSKGEIYQYVGDEIIISWKPEFGAQNANCLNCFFEIQKALRQRHTYFETRYQVQPEFKAGLHFGFVIAGEVGVVKRDIAYSGDVLNTTARIQSKCNDLGVNILVSKLLIDQINPENNGYTPKPIGDMELRGKAEKVALFTI
ncbi:MAG: adenylate/guanylate cyclase domain-containing protein [Lewinellaceae bacterium]|nr:adenylate/guanylate cyclase domain-containing protein [Lewinellaceae bacterium]